MDLEQEIENITERNKRVENDKAWETSWVRKIAIAAFTYTIAASWLIVIDNSHPFLNAFVPTGGYLLSTLTLPLLKKWWIQHILDS